MAVHNEAAHIPNGVASPGILVTNATGRLGITTDWIKKSGPNKGKTVVMWVGMGYEVAEWPEDLTPVKI